MEGRAIEFSPDPKFVRRDGQPDRTDEEIEALVKDIDDFFMMDFQLHPIFYTGPGTTTAGGEGLLEFNKYLLAPQRRALYQDLYQAVESFLLLGLDDIKSEKNDDDIIGPFAF